MKFSKKALIFPLLLAGMTLASCSNGGGGGKTTTQDYTYATSPSGEKAYSGTYYHGCDLTVSGTSLLYNLHVWSIQKHTTMIRYSQFSAYTKASTNPRSIDQDGTNSSKNVMFYTGKLVDKSASYTREHVWPCVKSSGMWVHDKTAGQYYVDGSTYVGGGSDLYHIRPATANVNTARGSSRFYEFGPNDTVYPCGDGGPYVIRVDDANLDFASKCEPPLEFRGDIARILIYVYTRYGKIGDYNDSYCGSLSFTNVMGYDTPEECMEILAKWNAIDPVDDTERLRNDTIERIQGNRNPYVDHPEFVAKIFGLEL